VVSVGHKIITLVASRDCTVELRLSNGTAGCLVLIVGAAAWNAAMTLSNVPGF
jgi:hypothetical protein